jgi:hypothetical protein
VIALVYNYIRTLDFGECSYQKCANEGSFSFLSELELLEKILARGPRLFRGFVLRFLTEFGGGKGRFLPPRFATLFLLAF